MKKMNDAIGGALEAINTALTALQAPKNQRASGSWEELSRRSSSEHGVFINVPL